MRLSIEMKLGYKASAKKNAPKEYISIWVSLTSIQKTRKNKKRYKKQNPSDSPQDINPRAQRYAYQSYDIYIKKGNSLCYSTEKI
jgi:hypothetical protein